MDPDIISDTIFEDIAAMFDTTPEDIKKRYRLYWESVYKEEVNQ